MRSVHPILLLVVGICVLHVRAGMAQVGRVLDPDEAVRLGLAGNEAVRAARADAAAAGAQYRQARAARLPSVSSRAAYTRLSDNIPEIAFDTSFLPGLDTSFTLAPVELNRYRAELTAEQVLFTGFRLDNQIRAARRQARAAEHLAAQEESDVAFRIREAYWRLDQALAALDATEEALAQVEAHLRDVENRRNAGAALASDVLAVQTRRSEVRLDRVEAENAVQLARLTLNRLIGLPLDADVRPSADIDIQSLTDDVDGLVARALDARPALQALGAEAAASDALLDASQGAWFPEVALNGRYVYARPNEYFFTEQDIFKATWEAGVALRWDIWDGGSRRAEAGEARARFESAEARLEAARQDVAVDVTRQFLEVGRALAALAVAEQLVEEAEEALRVMRQQYVQGVALSADVLDAEQAFRSAQARRVQARADYAIARAALRNAVGEI